MIILTMLYDVNWVSWVSQTLIAIHLITGMIFQNHIDELLPLMYCHIFYYCQFSQNVRISVLWPKLPFSFLLRAPIVMHNSPLMWLPGIVLTPSGRRKSTMCCTAMSTNTATVEHISKAWGGDYWAHFLRSVISRFFLALSKHMFAIEYHVCIWQMSPQLSCGDTCQIWMWSKEFNRLFRNIESLAYGEINERSFITPQPWFTAGYKPKSGHG